MRVILGRALSALVIAVLVADAAVNLLAPRALENEMAAVQFPVGLSSVLAVIMLVCAAAYALPRTSIVGAILITGFFGGAIAIHLRVGEIFSPPQIVSLVLGAATWGGIYLRDTRWQAMLFRSR